MDNFRMDNLMCAQLLTLGAGFQIIAGDWAMPICLVLMVVAVGADAWRSAE